MARDEPSDRPRETYHHGNLRQALMQAARRLIGESGAAGFTMAEVARAAGVSPAAPYRHFRDRNALVAEIARLGFERLADDLDRAWNDGKPDPVRAIETVGRAYLAFARSEPATYAAMFEAGFPFEQDAALLLASDRAFGVLRRAADAACAAARSQPRPPALMVALHLWAMAHGIASLFVGHGSGAKRKLPMSAEDLLEAGLLIYLQSLDLDAGSDAA